MDEQAKPKVNYSDFKKILEMQRQQSIISGGSELQKAAMSGSLANQQLGDTRSELQKVAFNSELNPKSAKVIKSSQEVKNKEEEIKVNKEQLDVLKELVSLTKDSAKSIADLAKERQGQTTGERVKGSFSDKFGSLRNVLNTAGIVTKGSGGFVDRALSKREDDKNFVKGEMKLRGVTKEEAVNKLQQVKSQEKIIKQNENEISKYTKLGISEKQLAGTEQGKSLLKTRNQETTKLAALDFRVAPKADFSTMDSEKETEMAKVELNQTSLLQQIAENTGGVNGKSNTEKVKQVSKDEGDGLLSGILGGFTASIMKSLKIMFNPMNILKVLTKVFAPVMIIGSLVSGIMDGFKAWKETGSITEALISGLAGILEFLSFGLVDAESIKNIIKTVHEFVNEYIVEPIGNFFKNIKDGILNMISKIGIPEIKFTVPIINKEVSVGPFYPFAGIAKNVETPAPSNKADNVYTRSEQNATASMQSPESNNSTLVNAPTVNNVSRQNNIIRSPIRNQEASVNSYIRSRYATQ